LATQSAAIRIEGGNIELIAPGKIEFKASKKELAGPASGELSLPALPKADQARNDIDLMFLYEDLSAVPGAPYKVRFADGTAREGKLDDKGQVRLLSVPYGEYTVEFGEDPRDWEPPPLPEGEHKDPKVREQGRLAIEQARMDFERKQA
jgi:hypothetical protein